MKFNKKFLAIILIIILIFFIAWKNIDNRQIRTSDEQIDILTSFYPIYIMTLNITNGAENVRVQNMAETYTGCIHDYTLTTSDLRKFENCDVFIQNGIGLETFTDKIIESYPETKVINTADGIENLIKEGEEDDEEEVNSHIWLSISNYIREVQNITSELKKIDGKNKKIYEANSEKYINELYKLRRDYNELNLKGKKAINLNESLEYLLEENKIETTLVETDHEQASISAMKIKEIIELIETENIENIFIDKNDSTKLAEVLRSETSANIYVLDSGLTGSSDTTSFIDTMKANYEVLKEIK